MARPNKQKISTQGEVGSGFFQAFASLNSEGLPEGESRPVNEKTPQVKKMGRVVLRRETAHRGGKAVTIIDDFEGVHDGLFIDDLAKKLRNHCGCGGAVKARAIELQGEQAAKARLFLEDLGFKVAGIR